MPGANEVLGCPRIFSIVLVVHQFFSNLFHEISDDFFLAIYPNFSQIPPFFASVFKFQENSLLAASCTGSDIFLFFFSHLPSLFYENWPLGCPSGWISGVVAPSALPLHATAFREFVCLSGVDRAASDFP